MCQYSEEFKKAVTEIVYAFNEGLYMKDQEYYRSLGPKYGPLAFEVFKATNPPLDWCYTLARSRSANTTPEEVEFWIDEQAVLALYEALELEGYFYVSA